MRTRSVIVIGIMIGILIYLSIFSTLTFNSRDLRLYIVLLFGDIALHSYLTGLTMSWFPNTPVVNNFIFIHAVTWSNTAVLLFTCEFFQLKTKHRIIYRTLLSAAVVFIATSIAAHLFNYKVVPLIQAYFAMFCYLLLICNAFYQGVKKSPYALYYLLGIGSYLFFAIYTTLGALGVLPYSDFARHSFSYGLLLQVIFYALAVVQKIDNYKKINADLERRAWQADAENQAKSEFLARMSHEIRTPINGVLGMAQLLSTTKLDDGQKHFTDTLINSGKTLLNVINDILDYAKVESGKMSLESHPFNLDELVTQNATVFTADLNAKNLSFMVQIDADCPFHLIGDSLRYQQVLNNLISNAKKFTEKGYIAIGIKVNQFLDNDYLTIETSIKDSGIGLTPDEMSSLFSPFMQASTSTTRKYGGTGLGLSICKKIVELMQGTISVASRKGEGSEFTFTTVFKIDQRKEQQRLAQFPQLHGKHLGIIFPDKFTLEGLEKMSRSWGLFSYGFQKLDDFNLWITNGGQRPDVILVYASSMQNVATHELEKICQLDRPIILMEAVGHVGMTALQNQYPNIISLVIPCSATLVRHTIAELFPSLSTQKIPHAADKPKPRQENLSELAVLVAEDNDTNRMVIGAMLKRENIRYDFAFNGAQALKKYREQHEKYDLILMDCEMPTMDGFQAAEAIRRFEKANQLEPIPIIALTAHALREFHNRCYDAGMDRVMTKPVSMELLRVTLSEYVKAQSLD